MSFEIQLPVLGTLAANVREQRFVKIESRLRRNVPDVTRFNLRVLNTVPVLLDLQWFILVSELLYAVGGDDLKLEAPGDVTTANLLRRLAVVQGESLLHPPLQSELAGTELPKAEVWAFNGQPLANPFLEEIGDLESQAYLTKHHPELATLLELEAKGGPTYKAHFAAIEKDRLLKVARSYSGKNPFLPSGALSEPNALALENQTLITELHRTNLILAEQLEREAKLPGVNPFGVRARNETRKMVCFKSDPRLAALLEAAASFEEAQLATEIRQGEEAAAKARAASGQTQARQNLHQRRARFGG